ncbi:hypothetical protein O0L34_g7726 [Tuta absoluta]|nr:hypothetical protein O0L34_g7726 [Tuta absoluta]
MHYLYLVLLVGIITGKAFCRPPLQNVAESQGNEAEYEEEEAASDEGAVEESESKISPEDSAANEQEENDLGQSANELDVAKQQMESQTSNTNDEVSRYNLNKNNEYDAFEKRKNNDESQSPAEQCDSSKLLSKSYVEKPDDKTFLRRDDTIKALNNEKLPIDKRTLQSQPASNEDGDILFERSLQSSQYKTNSKDFADASSQFHFAKQPSNPVYESVHDFNKYKINLERDRRDARDVKETIQTLSAIGTKDAGNAAADGAAAADTAAAVAVNAAAAADAAATAGAANCVNNVEDEETAIKRHVEKLSAQELKELLNSLSEDKRQLLIKIMGNQEEYNVEINKREITKKAGVAPDNSLVENGQSDLSKLRSCVVSEASSNTESTGVGSSKVENSQSSTNVLPVTSKSTDADNETSFSPLLTVKKVEIPNTMDTSNLADPKSNLALELKMNNKRETSDGQLTNVKGSSEEEDEKFVDNDGLLNEYGNFGRAEKDMSEFDDAPPDTGFYNKIGNALKREASDKNNDAEDALMSLEDSFPHANAYDDNESEMAPLVRVKRKNLESSVNKRSAGIASDSKVAFCPYRAENEDEDNDEGSEFDDDGFYDRTSNLAKSVVKDTIASDGGDSNGAPNNVQDDSVQSKTNIEEQINLVNPNKSNRDVASIGSDTDSVLSGGEGIDENLMYNGALRNKRTFSVSKGSCAGEEAAADELLKEYDRPAHSTVLDEEIAVTQNSPNFNEKDALNPLTRSFEGEVGRYKRIRRVKQPVSPETDNL